MYDWRGSRQLGKMGKILMYTLLCVQYSLIFVFTKFESCIFDDRMCTRAILWFSSDCRIAAVVAFSYSGLSAMLDCSRVHIWLVCAVLIDDNLTSTLPSWLSVESVVLPLGPWIFIVGPGARLLQNLWGGSARQCLWNIQGNHCFWCAVPLHPSGFHE